MTVFEGTQPHFFPNPCMTFWSPFFTPIPFPPYRFHSWMEAESEELTFPPGLFVKRREGGGMSSGERSSQEAIAMIKVYN